jgi:hypothetical protein
MGHFDLVVSEVGGEALAKPLDDARFALTEVHLVGFAEHTRFDVAAPHIALDGFGPPTADEVTDGGERLILVTTPVVDAD